MAITDAKVDDERGRRVTVMRAMWPAPRWPWNVPDYRCLSPRIRRSMVYAGLLEIAFLGSAVLAGMLAFTTDSRAGAFTVLSAMAASFLGWFIVNQVYHWAWTGRGRRFAARALAAHGTCPSCGYGIAGVRQDRDGLTTCPECASAWRVGAIAACGWCEYSLMGASLDERGAMRCPECGWVWDSRERV